MSATLVRLAPWVALSAVAGYAFGLPGLLAGGALLALSESLQFFRDARAIDAANAMALARRSADTEAMAARMTAIEHQLKEALTPERVELTRQMMKAKLGGALR